ncbi:hypothetical protein VTK73DRAFT_8623 [Phialemonium thermophilum]|uniref:Uncharacterized protein n=1 Tax=Phialemonium thermophilum TaxID=223376 RepID=A0ABR3W7D8_9PEZI
MRDDLAEIGDGAERRRDYDIFEFMDWAVGPAKVEVDMKISDLVIFSYRRGCNPLVFLRQRRGMTGTCEFLCSLD